MTWTSAFGRACGVLLQAIVNGLALTRISPNVLTFIGLIINSVAAVFFGLANSHNYVRFFLYAGLVIIGAGIFDMVDGRVARQTDQVTVFGAFFDSVIDRYSDVVLFFGLLVFYARGNRFFYVVLTAFVMITSLMVSYTRARSEALIGSCKVGFMERPERVVLIILGALFERWGVMAPALWVLAVLSTITVIHRISYTYTIANGRRLDPRGAATRAGVDPRPADPQPVDESQPVPIRPASGPGPISGTASVSAAEHDLIPAPNTRA
jgi:CDP-diacylglycerol---glycerol-3-phosphate 3-phosphatidyltransferase